MSAVTDLKDTNRDADMRVSCLASRVSHCFHCQEPIPTNLDIRAVVGGCEQAFCCHGCRGVAELIASAGLDDYYRFRNTPATSLSTAETPTPDEWRAYDNAELLDQLTAVDKDGTRSATLALDGIGCAACGWLIDRMLKREANICAVNVNVATARVFVRWRDSLPFSALLQRIARLGYKPHPLNRTAPSAAIKDEKRLALKRLAVAGFGMMQVMMFAVAMYSSDLGSAADAMSPAIRNYLRGISLLCATPVMFYAGWPFFINAWRAIRARAIVMDVPVSIALVLAYSASIWNTLSGSGEVYFDSVVMFVFFLSLGRFVEMLVRHRTGDVTDALARMMPRTAHRVRGDEIEEVGVSALSIGDEVWVRCGETVPADGIVLEGSSRIDEAMLTGESQPVARGTGSTVTAGTMNVQAPIRIRITAIGQTTVLSSIVRLLQGADAEQAPLATAADRAASWFLGRILVGAGVVAAAWLVVDPSKAFETTLAVLVVTCPCALSLATPTALAAATATLARRGVLVVKAKALENLAKITRVVFDKTGTLTHGQPSVYKCDTLAAFSETECRRIAAALERTSEHPIAVAFGSFGNDVAGDAKNFPGRGVEGVLNGHRYRIGRAEFVAQLRGAVANDDMLIHLGDTQAALAAFHLTDSPRSEARDVIAALQARKLPAEILSGDAWSPVAHTAKQCGIETFNARQSPTDKLKYVRELSERGECVAMIGDGVNDAPVLKGAAVSVAMGRASALAQVSADIVLVGDSLRALPHAIDVARKTQRIIKQNLAWAATYNLLALPLAAFGFVPPWLAAIGMSFSSVVVVLNAMRLLPKSRRETGDAKYTRLVHNEQLSTLKPVARSP